MVRLSTDFRRDFERGSSNLEPRLKLCGGGETHWGCGGRKTHGGLGVVGGKPTCASCGGRSPLVGVVRGKPISGWCSDLVLTY